MSIASQLPFDVLSHIFEAYYLGYVRKDDLVAWVPTVYCGLDSASLVCRSWRKPSQRILFRRVYLEAKGIDSFFQAIKASQYLRNSVRILYFETSESTREKVVHDIRTPDIIFSIISLLGPTLHHLAIPSTHHLDDFSLVTFTQLRTLDSCFSSHRPLDLHLQAPSLTSFSSSLFSTSLQRQDESLDLYPIRLIGPTRLTTLSLTTYRATSDLLSLISSVGSTLINLSVYFELGFDQLEGARSLLTTVETLKRFRYHANTDPEIVPGCLVLESILPKLQTLEVLSVLSHSISSDILHKLPRSMKYLEVVYHFPTLSIEDLTHPLQDSSFKSSLETIAIVIDDEQIDEYDYEVNIDFPSTRKTELEISDEEIGTYELFHLCEFSIFFYF